MAKKKSDKYPYQWSDGTFHSITEEKHVQNRGKPLSPPPGSYDPNLDIQEGQANRGLGNLLENLDVTGDRALEDYGIGNAAFDVQGKRNQEDYDTAKGLTERGYARQGADLSTALKQGGEDYGTNVAGLQRQYKQLGDQQGGQQRQAGAFAGSGAAIQAARKRVENEAYDRAPIDTAYSRFKEGNALAQTRLGEDQTSDMSTLDRQLHRGEDDITVGRGGLVTGLRRTNEDIGTQGRQAKDENTEFGQDIAKVRQFQAGTPLVFAPRPGATSPGATPPPVATTNQPSTVGNSLVAGPNAPRQPGAARSITTTKKKGKKTRTYGTSVTTA
jgi:hypothetical protein